MAKEWRYIFVVTVMLWTCCGFMAVEGITIDPQQQIAIQLGATNVQMRCTLQRYGVVRPVTYQWYHQTTDGIEKEITTTPHFTIAQDGSFATIDSVLKEDSGVFTAIATDSSNKTGNCTFFMQVSYAPVFETPTATQVIRANAMETVVLNCTYDSSPESTVTWLKNNVTLGSQQRYVVGGRNLTITDVDSSDKGSYQCTAANSYGSAVSSPITIVVQVPMKFLIIPSTVNILTKGENATLTCSAQGSPIPTIEWTKDTFTLTNNRLRTITQNITGDVITSTIDYSEVSLEDKGTYICNARNADQALKHTFEVAVSAPPEITSVFDSVKYVKIGSPLTLHCQASGIPEPSFTWFKDDRAIARVAETHFQEGWDGYLRVAEVIGTDAGLYQCRAVNDVGEAFSETFTLVVTGLHFLVKPRPNRYIVNNATFEMNCQVAGTTNNVQVDWLKDGKQIPGRCTEAKFNNSLCTGTFVLGQKLHITKMSQADVGVYSCVATEQGGRNPESIRAQSRIQILVPVEFDPAMPATVRGDYHRGLKLRCMATGVPTPKIEWFRHGVHVLNNTYRTVIGGLMKFRALHVADADRYTCIASNKAGEKFQNVNIVINTKLNTPAALSVTIAPFSYFAQVQWSIIANGGYRVTSYQLEYRQIKPTVSEWTIHKDIGANQRGYGMKDLEPEATYQINVWANNELGKGEVVTMEFQTKEGESGGILQMSISQLVIIIVIVTAAIGMLIAIICVILIKRSNLTGTRARQGAQDDNQALVNNQQDHSSHVNPAYDGSAATSNPQKDMELKEVKNPNGEGKEASNANATADTDPPAAQNGGAKKETTTT